jgi:hypothetical protein
MKKDIPQLGTKEFNDLASTYFGGKPKQETMKQTAVEWLFNQIPDHLRLTRSGFEMLQQAKEMEKQQIIDAHGSKLKNSRGTSNFEYWYTGEQYYNETFKKQ